VFGPSFFLQKNKILPNLVSRKEKMESSADQEFSNVIQVAKIILQRSSAIKEEDDDYKPIKLPPKIEESNSSL